MSEGLLFKGPFPRALLVKLSGRTGNRSREPRFPGSALAVESPGDGQRENPGDRVVSRDDLGREQGSLCSTKGRTMLSETQLCLG